MQIVSLSFLLLCLAGCKQDKEPATIGPVITFGQPVRVQINGYAGNAMEPFLSRDGTTLFFNNLNSAPENTNLHWATIINDTTFQYQGEIAGINTPDLEGVPTLDSTGHLYFVSNRHYANTLSTLYQSDFLNGTATHIQLIAGVSKLLAGWVNFDVEVSADGQTLYFVDAQFDQAGNPATADLVMAKKNGTAFERWPAGNTILQSVNTPALEYAACISADELELYFTRLPVPATAASSPEILVCSRQHQTEAFGSPQKIESITGFAEAPTISPGNSALYYHKKENNRFVLYMLRRK